MKEIKMSSKNGTKVILGWVVLAVVLGIMSFIILRQSPLHPWVIADSQTDSSVFRTVGFQMMNGMMPYRDTFDHKGPLLYLINYWGESISFEHGVWFFEFLALLSSFIMWYRIARLVARRIIAIVTIIPLGCLFFHYFGGGNLTEEYALPFISASLFFFLDYFFNDRISRLRLVLCGMCFGAVLLLRPNMISVWVLFCIAVLFRLLKEKQYAELLKSLFWFLVGACLIIIPIIIWLVIENSFSDFIYQYLIFNFKYCGTVWSSKITALKYFGKQSFSIVIILISIVLLLRKREKVYLLDILFALVSLLFISVSGVYSGADNYILVLIPGFVHPIASFGEDSVRGIRDKSGVSKFLGIVGLLMFLALCLFFSKDWVYLSRSVIQAYDTIGEDRHSPEVSRICQYIDNFSEETDSISVLGNEDIYYLLSKRLPCGKYSYQWPIAIYDKSIVEEFSEDIRQYGPRFIIQTMDDIDISSLLSEENYIPIEELEGLSDVTVYMKAGE